MKTPPSRRLHVALHLLTAGALLLGAIIIEHRLELALHLGAFRDPLVALGLLFLPLAALAHRPTVSRWSVRLCLVVLAMVLAVLAVEIAARWVRFDFRWQQALLGRTPPNWRLPRVPTGTVFYRREGNQEWTGQVTRTYLKSIGLIADAYADEAVITVRYDEFGFRNEPRPAVWEIAVAGDSFTELGDVPFDRLFTTLLARNLKRPVLNLGVGGTGPLTHLSYLRDYGLSSPTRHTVVVFFEGNDLWDLPDEYTAEQRFAETGQRRYRQLKPQTSFLRALGERWGQAPLAPSYVEPRVDGFFRGPDRELPITLGHPPPGRDGLSTVQLAGLESFFSRYAEFGKEHSVSTWLAYMPCKERVLYGHIRWAPDAEEALREWKPNDLPEVIDEYCQRHGIRFLDLTPDLVRHTRDTGELVFNQVHDCHLNARGSEVVADTLTRAFTEVERQALFGP